MTSRSKAQIKSFFETGDTPTEDQFIDLIDSYVDKSGPLGTLETAASAGSTGFCTFNSGIPSIAGYSSVLPSMGITVYTTAQAITVITSSDNNTFYGQQVFTNSVFFTGKTLFPDDGRRFISSGIISLSGTSNTIETQSSAATDDLDGISTTGSGLFWVIRAESDDRTIVMRHNQSVSAAIYVPNGVNITLDTNKRYVGGIYDDDLDKHIVLFDGTTKEYVDAEVSAVESQITQYLLSTSIYQSSSTSVPTGSWTTVLFDAEDYDDGNWHSTSLNTERITVDFTGRVLVLAHYNSNTTNNGIYGLRIRKNGTTIATENISLSSGATSQINLSVEISVSSGDYIDMQVFQGSGGTVTTGTGLGGTKLTVRRVK